jgi:DNA-directed RNA polymerase subunit RPC12/RpoP
MKVTCLDCGRKIEPKYLCSLCGKDEVIPCPIADQLLAAAIDYIEATEYAHHCPARGLVKERLKDLSDAVHEYQEKDL